MAELNVQQQNLIKELKQTYPELRSYSDEQILTIYNQQLTNVQLSEAERISIMSGRNGVSNDGVGLQVETIKAVELTKEQENELLSALTKRINDVTANTQKVEEENGFLGKAWNWAKNTPLLDWCTDSTNDIKKAQQADLKALESGNIKEAFKQITGLDYTVENVNKFLNNEIQTTSEQALNGYKEGQDMASDVVADIFSGIAAVGIYTAAVALAPVSGGASIAVGIAAATASGAAIKTGIKFADTVSSEREYTSDNLKRDLATGAFSGVLAPITGGMGGAVGKTVATKMGVQAVKQVGKEVADTVVESGIKQGIKTALTNPTGYEYVGGTLLKRSLAFGAEMATDGAIGGAVDNAFRTAYDGGSLEDVGNAAVTGGIGGLLLSPVIGGGMKTSGKVFGKLADYIKGGDASPNTIPTASLVNESQMTNEIPKTAEEIAEELVTKNIKNNINNLELRTREEMLDLFKVFDITESDLEGIDFMQPSIQSFMNFYSLMREYGGPIPGATKATLLKGLRKENSDFDTIASMFAHIKREHFELIKENLPSESCGIDLYSTLLTRIMDDGGDFNIILKNKIDVYKKLKELYPHENKYDYAGIVGQINENNASKLLNFITEIVEKDKLQFLNLCYMVESFGVSSDAIDNKIIMYKFLKEEGVPIENAQKIVGNINDDSANARIELFKILKSEGFDNDLIDKSLRGTNNFNIQARKELIELLKAEHFDNSQIAEIINKTKGNSITSKVEILKLLKDNPDCSIELKTEFISATEDYNFQLIKDLYNEIGIDVGNILHSLTSKRVDAQTQIFKILKERDANIKKSTVIIEKINDKNLPLAKVLCEEGIFSEAEIEKIVLGCGGRISFQGVFERQASISELINAKLELYQYFKENSLIPKKPLSIKEQMSEHVELQLGGKPKYPLIESGADIISVVNKSNINLAKKLCHKDLDPMLIKQILVRYDNKSDDIILKFIDDGLLAKYPKLVECPANSWKAIIDKDLVQYVDKFGAHTVVALAKSNNPNILNDFVALRNDAFAHRSLLKSGIEDLTDMDLNSLLNEPETVRALGIVGKGTLEAAFPLKVEGFKDCCEDIARLKLSPENMETLMQKINPTNSRTYREISEKIAATKRRINELVGEETCNQIKALQNQRAEIEEQLKVLTARKNELATTLGEESEEIIAIKNQLKELQKQSKALGGQAQSLYFKGDNADEIKRIMNAVNALNKELQNITKESKSLEPQDILTKIRVLAAISEKADDKEIAKFIELIKPSNVDNNANWNEAINRKLFDVLGVEYDEAVSTRLDLINCKYLADMFLSDEQFNQNFAKLINLVKEHPDKSIAEIFDLLPQNQETRRMFEEIGVDYDKWCQIDKDSYKSARIQLDAEKAKQAAIQSLEEDLNDELFKILPKENTQQILDNLEAAGIILKRSQIDVFVGDGVSAGQKEFYRLYKDGNPIVFEDMPQIISIIEKTINKDEFWFREHPNVNINEARKHIYEHLIKLRTNDVDVAKSIATNDVVELEIRKTDMYDIKKAIGLGNDGQCCTAVGNGCNAFSAPTYIMNKCIGAIELVDQGNFVGNTMIYLANVDGKPALVLDNIELKSKYRYNDTIRDTFMDYAKQLCDEIGQPDLPIYAGPNRHKLTMDAVYPKENHSMQIIGSTGEDRVYIDGITGGMTIDGQATLNLEMYKIR